MLITDQMKTSNQFYQCNKLRFCQSDQRINDNWFIVSRDSWKSWGKSSKHSILWKITKNTT